MSELMDRAVLGMPYDLAMGNELSRMQFWSRTQLVVKRLEAEDVLRDELLSALQGFFKNSNRHDWPADIYDAAEAAIAKATA